MKSANAEDADPTRVAPDAAALRERLAYLEAIVRAIREGSVDGVVVGPSSAERLYTLQGTERVYRQLVEGMADGLATVAPDGLILYANQSLADTTGRRLEDVIGSSLLDRVAAGDREPMARLLAGHSPKVEGIELSLRDAGGHEVPVLASAAGIEDAVPPMVCLAFTDLTDVRAQAAAVHRANQELRVNADALTEANLRFRAVFDQGPLAMARIDGRGRYAAINPAMAELTGYTSEEIIGRSLGALVHPDDHDAETATFRAIVSGASDRSRNERRYVRRDGSVVWVSTTLGAIRAADGALLHCLEMVEDISERQRVEESRRRLAAIVEHTDDAVLAKTAAGVISEWNRGAERLFGYGAAEVIGRPITMLIPPDRVVEEEEMRAQVFSGQPIKLHETVRMRKDGTRIDIALTDSPIRDASGMVVGAASIARDITERKRFEGQLQHLADHDPLTGLFNRRRFGEELGRELDRARRHGGGGAVLAIDLDHFKYINDSLGHAAGDELIITASEILRRRARSTDVIARLGGDEFALILPGVDSDQAVGVATDLLDALRREDQVNVRGSSRHVTASIGVAPFAEVGDLAAEDLLVEADIALYDAKEAGRNRAAVFDRSTSPGLKMHGRLTWSDRIHRALEEDQFVLFAQPIVSLQGDSASRYELLLRMVDDDGGLVAPGAFLEVAERLDLIGDIDRWVVRTAIARLAREQAAHRDVRLSVNLSAISICDPDLPRWIDRELRNADAAAPGLCFEITETAAIVNIDRATSFARQIADLGCELALDDFGAGFASFYYLKHLRFDYLKIDGEFVKDLATSAIDQSMVQSMAAIAENLGGRTIAEFASDTAAVDLLREYGVHYAQGFFLGEPTPLDQTDLSRPAAIDGRRSLSLVADKRR